MKLSRMKLRKIIAESISRDEYGFDALEKQATSGDDFFNDGEADMTSSQLHSYNRQKELKDMKLNKSNAYEVHIHLASALGDDEGLYDTPALGVAASKLATRFSGNSSAEIMPEVMKVLNGFLNHPKLPMMQRKQLRQQIPQFQSMLRSKMDSDEF